MLACLIFDCDGTLVDSERLGMEAFVATLATLGILVSTDNCLERYRGWQLDAMVSDVARRTSDFRGDEFIPLYRKHERELLASQLRPIPGVKRMLDRLILPKCVASSAPLDKIRRSLQTTGLGHYFGEKLFSSYEIKSWKPEPDLFLHAAKSMGFLSSQCAVIEDSRVGVEAALAARMKVFYFGSEQKITEMGEVTMFQHMSELPNLILSS
ncbi:MAG: HAD-IA family hydrolase [Caldilineaceae bacterium]